MQITAICKATGKYKEQFKSTGLLLEKAIDGEDVWVDVPGKISYTDYKGKKVTVDAEQNDKGYWSGTIVGGASSGGQSDDSSTDNRDRSVSMSYAKDLVVAGKADYNSMCAVAQEILDWVEGKSVDEPQF